MSTDDQENNPRDNPTNENGGNQRDNEVNSGDDNAVHPTLFDSAFAALELLALVFWILSEKLQKSWIIHSSLLSLAVTLFVLGAANVVLKLSKRPLVVWSIAAIISALCSLLVFESSIPEKTPKPGHSLPEQLAREIDDPIRRAILLIRLSRTNEFETLCPLSGQLRLSKMTDRGIYSGVHFMFNDYPAARVETQERECAFQTQISGNEGAAAKAQSFMIRRTKTDRISLPVSLWSIQETPFKTLRSFHQSFLTVTISSNLVPKVQTIELVVNGWSVFSVSAKGRDWRDDRDGRTLLSFKGDDNRPPTAGFILDMGSENLTFSPVYAGPLPIAETMDFFMINPEGSVKPMKIGK